MKRLICILLTGLVILGFIPSLRQASGAPSTVKTVWENPWTLTTFRGDGKVNSTFFSFPKVVWNGSQWVDYIFNSSDMSGGIGSVYIKVRPTHTIIYDPNRSEERIKYERWTVEWYDESAHRWRVDHPIESEISYAINSSGICFSRKSTLDFASTLEVYYMLKKGSKLKISVRLTPGVSRKYRIVWKLTGIAGFKAQWAMATENIENTAFKIISDKNYSWIRFIGYNNTGFLLDWFDTYWFNKTTEEWETCFQRLELHADAWHNCQTQIFFGNFTISQGESVYLDPSIVTFNSEASLDGYVEKYGQSYPPGDGTNLNVAAGFIVVGQEGKTYGGLCYHQWRSYVSFDTSSIPSLAFNLSAKLRLKTESDYSGVDFNLRVMGGEQPLYGDSLNVSDWGCGMSEISMWDTANYSRDGIYINLTIPSEQINKAGRTQFELKSSREGNVPTRGAEESVYFYSGDSVGNEPKLEVTYHIDAETINGMNWYYRNVCSDKAVIVLFGGYTYYTTFVKINCIDHVGSPATEKSKPKIELINGLIANGFSILTNKDDPVTYTVESIWIKDAVTWLRDNAYRHIYLFGFSAGGVAVAYEIQKEYATFFSATVVASAPVNSENSNDPIFRSANTASKVKVATCFLEGVEDEFYNQMLLYYNNTLVHKEWHNWNGEHDVFPNTCKDHGENVTTAVVNWYNAPHPPSTPFTPSGSTSGYTGTPYSYSTSTIDPNGDNVCYKFDWGDESTTTTDWYASDVTAMASHNWESSGTYYVKVRAKDFYGAWSSWSSNLTVAISSGGGGGGGGCPYVYTWNGERYVMDNNLLPASEISNGADVEDYYKLEQTLVPTHQDSWFSRYSLQIGEFENEHSYLDQVKLIAVDHDSDVNMAVTPDGQILTYREPEPPISCVDNNGGNRLSQILRVDGSVLDPATYFYGEAGDYLVLNFGHIASEDAKLILRDDMKSMIICIHVQIKNNTREWETVAMVTPRDYWAAEAADLSEYVAEDDFMVRLYWTSPHRLDYVGLDTSPQEKVELHQAKLIRATHSVEGNVKPLLKENDGNYAELTPDQQITLTFLLPNNQNEERTFILYTEGHYYTIA